MKPSGSGGMPALREHALPIDGLSLFLRHHPARRRREHTVLLLHGGNTSSRMYQEPDGGLVKFLTEGACDVWTLDWRSSALIVDPLIQQRPPLGGSEAKERALFTLDRVAEADIPLALNKMREHGVEGDISVLGFCLGGAALAMAVSRGYLETLGVGNVVLVTMGLFFEVPWNGWLKAEDFIIERLLSSTPPPRGVDPTRPEEWHEAMRSAYARWPKTWLAPGSEPIDALFRSLTFMYGEPYARGRLKRAFERRLLTGFFGSVHLGLFLHAGQLVRRGYAARFDELDVIDRARLDAPGSPSVTGDLVATHFENKRVTAVTGAEDRLWHRDSIDLMYEWLRNEAAAPRERRRHRKHVVPHYGHLDLFWSEDAARDVYPLLRAAIEQPPLDASTEIERNPIVAPEHSDRAGADPPAERG